MTAPAHRTRPDWRRSTPRFPCGDPRTPENTHRGACRTCHNARSAKYRRRRGVPPRARAVDELRLRLAMPPARPPRPYLVAPNFAAILEEVRPEYLRAIGAVDDERQLPLFPEDDARG